MLDVTNMPKRKALYNKIMELEATKKPHQKIIDNYNIGKRFTPKSYARGTYEWEIASDARAEIRRIDKKIQPLLRKMKNTLE